MNVRGRFRGIESRGDLLTISRSCNNFGTNDGRIRYRDPDSLADASDLPNFPSLNHPVRPLSPLLVMHNHLALNVTELSTTSRSSALPAPNTPSPVSALPTEALGVHKEVGFELLERARARHRKHGEVPYPMRSTNHYLSLSVEIPLRYYSHKKL